jgi:hypothetical protein
MAPRVKRGLAFAASTAVIAFGGAWVATVAWPGEPVARAVWTSAWIAFAVQLVTFVVAQPFLAKNPIAGWGLGSVLRLFALVLYAVVGLKLLALAATPALLSLAVFLFASMLVETLFLKP